MLSAGIYEVLIALAASKYPILSPWLLRIGLIWVVPDLDWLRDIIDVPPTEAISSCWLIFLGIVMIRGKRPIKTYIASEAVLSLPTVWMAGTLLIFGGGHVLRTSDGFIMLLVFAVFTATPVWLALKALRTQASGC